jgi:hypothetical protein
VQPVFLQVNSVLEYGTERVWVINAFWGS